MSNIKKLCISFLIITTLIVFIPIAIPINSTTYTVQAVDLNTYYKKITKGSTYTLKIKGTSKKPKWTSLNKKIATVNSKGKITAKKAGTTFVRATIGKKKYTAKIVVVNPPVKISKSSVSITKGSTYTLKMQNTSKKAKWKTSNSKIATVNSKGKVTAKKAGKVTITATIGKKKYTCKVTVNNPPNISKSSISIAKGSTYTLKMQNTSKKAKWKTSNSNIATVSSTGKVTAKNAGTATITATLNSKKYNCKVTVTNPNVKINQSNITILYGNTTQLKLLNNTQTATWKTSNSKVATVSSTGKVSAVGKGSTTITATIGSKKYTCKVTVEQPYFSNNTLYVYVKETKTNPLKGTSMPISYKSSNSKIIKVDSSTGKLTGIKSGTATITATVSNKNYTFKAIVINTPTADEFGIDVSGHQKKIDWDKVKKSGVKFAILRCGYGMNQEDQDDSQFVRNISECKRLNIPYGIYLFSYANTVDKAKSEAEHVLRLINSTKAKPELGIWYDVEDNKTSGSVSKAQLTKIINTFCNKIETSGYEVGIYASLKWLNEKIDKSITEKYPVWVAQYYRECNYEGKYVLWQYTSSGIIDGIDGSVDLNVRFK